jgi:GR25 family glycosyltransferase involved in LPS biosynthesis
MIKTYVINVDSATDRLERISCTLNEKLIPFKKIRAVTPEDFKRIKIACDCDILYPSMLVPACLVSHIKTLMVFIAEGKADDVALILEDDAVPAPALTEERLEKLLSTAPIDFEILQLGTVHTNYLRSMIELRRRCSIHWHDWHCPLWGAHAYLISLNGAEKLVKNLFPSGRLDLTGIYCPELCVTDFLFYRILKSYASTYPWFAQFTLESSVRPESDQPDRQMNLERNDYIRTLWGVAK